MPRRLVLAALLGSLVGCGPAPTSEAPDRPTLVIEPSETKLPTAAKRSHHHAPSCVLSHGDYASLRARWRLVTRSRRVSDPAKPDPEAPRADDVWARLITQSGGRVEVTLAGGHDEDVEVHFVGDGLELDTLALSEDVRFYAAEPIWLLGVVLIEPRHALEVLRADGQRIMLALDVGEDFVPERIQDRSPCASLALEPGDFQTAALVKLTPHAAYEIVGDEPVPVFPGPQGGEAGIALALGAGAQISAGREEGTRRRILISRRHFHVSGWVPTSRLRVPAQVHGTGGTGGSGYGSFGRRGFRMRGNRIDYRCATRVPLWILVGERRERVGAILPERDFYALPSEKPRGNHQPIFIEDAPVELDHGARFAVPSRELARCPSQP